jgi:hypothetical protein
MGTNRTATTSMIFNVRGLEEAPRKITANPARTGHNLLAVEEALA